LHYALSNGQPEYGPIAIADWSIIVQWNAIYNIGETWVLASIGAVVEMGVLIDCLWSLSIRLTGPFANKTRDYLSRSLEAFFSGVK
jgi:hypothetical protein